MKLLEREAPLEQALRAALQAAEGRGSVLLVGGEAGIGKSALIDALAEDLKRRRMRVLAGRCEALLEPLAALRDIARTGLPQRWPLFEAAATPLACGMLAVEDLHLADEATLDLLRFIGRRIARLPLLLVLSFRDDEVDEAHSLCGLLGELPASRLHRLALAPLSVEGVAQLCAGSGHDATGLHRMTGGNPFLVTESLACGVGDEARGVPSTVREAVQARLRRFSDAQRELLQLLSLMAGPCPALLAQALCPPGVESADVDVCILKGLLLSHGSHLDFRHELVRRAVADQLAPPQRRAAHGLILECLLRPPIGLAPPALATLAHHAIEAGDAGRVLEFAPAAAREAAANGAHRQAASLLAAALQAAQRAPELLRAELYETWSYQAGLSQGIDAQVIAARHQAIALWRVIDRGDKVGLNLRWLSRLHWYQGDAELAQRYAEQAVEALEATDSPLDHAWACSARAQLGLLRERPDEAQRWGRRAIELATAIAQADLLSNALNIVGTAGLQFGRSDALPQLQRSLALALEGGFHEQAARSYATLAGHAVMSKDFAGAQHWLDEATDFTERYKLDGRRAYLLAWQAQLRFDQGRWDEAECGIAEIDALPRLQAFARQPPQTVRARLLLRRGDSQGGAALQAALSTALNGGEAIRLLPLRLAEAESSWLAGDMAAASAALHALPPVAALKRHPWVSGELAVWRRRCGAEAVPDRRRVAPPWALELQGEVEAAARAWRALGSPYEAALTLLAGARAEPRREWLVEAAELLSALGAAPALQALQALARDSGVALSRRRSGSRAAASDHQKGLTARERQVLSLLAEGASNAGIGSRLRIAPRTVEHHVSAVLAKLGVHCRTEAVALAWRERMLFKA